MCTQSRRVDGEDIKGSTRGLILDPSRRYQNDEDLRQTFWWDGMKKDIAYFVACCDLCNRGKTEHQKLAGLLQPLPVAQWKWDDVCMDFITGLPPTPHGNNAIWVVVDMLTKVAHFIPIWTT